MNVFTVQRTTALWKVLSQETCIESSSILSKCLKPKTKFVLNATNVMNHRDIDYDGKDKSF